MLTFLFSISVIITTENATDVFHNPEKKPILLKLWASWCPHCKEFAPTWNDLESDPELQSQIVVAEIECEENRELCKNFEGQNYPRIYWIDRIENQTVRYFGTLDMPSFRSYIKKQLSFPLTVVDANELSEYIRDSNSITSFMFTVKSDDDNALRQAKEIAKTFRNFESRMLLQTSDKNELIAYTSPTRSTLYSGVWEPSSVRDFVIRNSVPFLTRLRASVLKHLDNEDFPFFAVVTKDNQSLDANALAVANESSQLLPAITANCVDDAWICRYCSIPIDTNHTEYLVFDRHKRLFWLYKGPFDTESVTTWVRDVMAGKVWAKGPGRGMFSSYLEEYYDALADGTPNPWQILMMPVIIVLFMVYGIASVFIKAKIKESKAQKTD